MLKQKQFSILGGKCTISEWNKENLAQWDKQASMKFGKLMNYPKTYFDKIVKHVIKQLQESIFFLFLSQSLSFETCVSIAKSIVS